MAGIGFQLRRLARQDTISSIVASAGHAAMIAAGPWLFTIMALLSISIATDQVAGLPALSSFRAIVIYAFSISLVSSAPATLAAIRLVGDALWSKKPEAIRPLLFGAFLAAIVPTAVALAISFLFVGLSLETRIVFVAMTFTVALIWVAIAFCGAVRDYRGVSLSFLSGLLIAATSAILLAVGGYQDVGMAWGFTAGLVAILIGLVSRIFATFPHPVLDPFAGFFAVLNGIRYYWQLALGALLGAMGVWADKWVFWLSPVSEKVENGLLHAPIYDSTMFIASLVIIPALASFVVKLETGFFERYQQYYAIIASHGTLDQIEGARHRLARYAMDSLTLITVTLTGLAAILILTAPIIIDATGLQFRQIAILRYGALGAVFHFVFIAASAMLLFFDRRRLYLYTQTLYLVLNAGLAVLSLRLGEDYYGTGYFVATLIVAGLSLVLADRTLTRLNFLTFIGNNPSIRGRVRRSTAPTLGASVR